MLKTFRSELFLWIHLAGLALVPLLLLFVTLGLAAGEPIGSYWFEFIILGIIGSAPIAWMQWFRPFSIFTLLFLTLDPKALTPTQRQILRLFKSNKQRLLSLLAMAMMWGILWILYGLAPLAAQVTPISPQWRSLGLFVAALSFLASNLFAQVPASVASIFLTSVQEWEATEPYEVEKIAKDFTLFGFWVEKILPPLESGEGS